MGVLGFIVFIVMPVFSLMPLLITTHFKGGVNDVATMEDRPAWACCWVVC